MATVAPGAPKSAAPCTSAVTPPPKLGTTKVKVRGYTASVDGVRFFLEPKGAGKAPFEVEAASLPMQSLLVSAFESKSEIEVAVDPSGCVPRVMFLRAP